MRDGEVLICQRSSQDSFPLKWEFPGGKIRPGEEPEIALVRELVEELAIDIRIDRQLMEYTHVYAGGPEVTLHFYLIREFVPEPMNRQFNSVRWVPVSSLGEYDFLGGDMKILTHLQQTFTDEY